MATNAQRAWRMDLLSKIEAKIGKIDWLGWYLNLDVKIPQKWNSKCDRTVPDNIILTSCTSFKIYCLGGVMSIRIDINH